MRESIKLIIACLNLIPLGPHKIEDAKLSSNYRSIMEKFNGKYLYIILKVMTEGYIVPFGGRIVNS